MPGILIGSYAAVRLPEPALRVVLAATLAATGTIPVASVALVLGIHRLMSQGLTPTNLVGNAVATMVVARWENALDMARMHRVLDGKAEGAAAAAGAAR